MVDELILINTFESSVKNKHITNDKRIALSVVEQNNPFNMVSIKGKVIDQTTEGADEHLKRLAKRYLGIVYLPILNGRDSEGHVIYLGPQRTKIHSYFSGQIHTNNQIESKSIIQFILLY